MNEALIHAGTNVADLDTKRLSHPRHAVKEFDPRGKSEKSGNEQAQLGNLSN